MQSAKKKIESLHPPLVQAPPVLSIFSGAKKRGEVPLLILVDLSGEHKQGEVFGTHT